MHILHQYKNTKLFAPLTGLCTGIEKGAGGFDCHRADGAICDLCA